jgi:hypothetical protein
MARGVVAGTSRSFNGSGFWFDEDSEAEDLDPDVEIFNPYEGIWLSHEDFLVIMEELFSVLASLARDTEDPATSSPWWPQFARDVREIASRVSGRPGPAEDRRPID